MVPVESSSTVPPSADCEGKLCRRAGDAITTVDCDICPIQSVDEVADSWLMLLAAARSGVGVLATLATDAVRCCVLAVLLFRCACCRVALADFAAAGDAAVSLRAAAAAALLSAAFAEPC